MIIEKTVFILGAGASMHAGFPSGRELVDLILESQPNKPYSISQIDHNSSRRKVDNDTRIILYLLLSKLGYGHDEIENFKLSLKQSQLNSVDAFLERRPEFIPIGKIFIAFLINYFENSDSLFKKPDWYKYVWNKMNTNFDDFENNQISFITFNYDKSLEYYFLNALIGISGKEPHECMIKLQKISIIHLHGQVGALAKEKPGFNFNYGLNMSYDSGYILQTFSENIKIIHEKIETDQEFKNAHILMEKAKKIIFLGFGYNQINISRLNLKDIVRGKIFGSAIGLTKKEIEEIQLKNFNFSLSNLNYQSCEEYLRNEIVLK